jgi:hypothetical protein
MSPKGMSQIEIALELQVSEASISSDIAYLRNQAKESIREYITEHLPAQYQVCLTALDEIIKRAFEILEKSDDNREKLQAMEVFKSDISVQKHDKIMVTNFVLNYCCLY